MAEVMTVLGPIAPDELGLTSMHEHILYDGSIYRRRFEALLPKEGLPVEPDDPVTLENVSYLRHDFTLCWDGVSMRDEEVMTAEIDDFKASGGSAMVDMSTPGLRCDLPAIKRISEKTGVHVVATTGLYAEDSWPDKFKEMSTEEYEQYMIREIEHGIEDTGIKPGHIKIAIEKPTEQGLKLLEAAARVSNQTGLSATIHQGVFMVADEVRRVTETLLQAGMKPKRTIICHVENFFLPLDLKTLIQDPDSWKLDLDLARELLDAGFNISIDCLGQTWDVELQGFVRPTDWQRLAALVALINAGYVEQMVLGTDTYMKFLTRRFGGDGYCRLTNAVLPILKMVEVSDEDIQALVVGNPARLLAGL